MESKNTEIPIPSILLYFRNFLVVIVILYHTEIFKFLENSKFKPVASEAYKQLLKVQKSEASDHVAIMVLSRRTAVLQRNAIC